MKTSLPNGLNIKMNSKSKTAKVIYSPHAKETVIIPRSITFQNQEYIIDSLNATFKDNKDISTIKFSKETQIKTISKDAFNNSTLEHISFPAHIQKIDESSFNGCHSLHNIEFPPDTMLISIGQSAFSESGIKSISIPQTVKFISKKAFQNCPLLETVIFPPEIKLNSISEYLFEYTYITVISIPSSVKKICDCAFKNCFKLKTVIFQDDSKLEMIGECAFESTSIEKFPIPSKVTALKKFCFYDIKNLADFDISAENKIILFYNKTFLMSKSDIESDIYDNLHFSNYNIENVVIPSFVKYIDSSAFSYHKKLQTVTFLNDSKIQLIDDNAFYHSSIKKIIIQPHIKIGDNAFKYCLKLKSIQCNEQKNSINRQICEIGEDCFCDCEKLEQVELLANELILGNECFVLLMKVIVVSFPNAEKITIGKNIFGGCSENLILFVRAGSELIGNFTYCVMNILT